MKRLLPRLTILKLAVFIMTAIILLPETGCKEKPACGNKRDHRRRKKRVHNFAPSMGYYDSSKTKEISFV